MDPREPHASYWLVALTGPPRRVRLSAEGPLLVGRGAHNHLVLNDYRISRQHSRVAHERDGFVVYDLNSSNGTFVNGTAVRRQQIKPGDEISFGPHVFKVEVLADGTTGSGTGTVKWRPTESITKFHQVNAPFHAPTPRATNVPSSQPPETQAAHQQTHPDPRSAFGGPTAPMGAGVGAGVAAAAAGGVARRQPDTYPPGPYEGEEQTAYTDDLAPNSRDSVKFRAAAQTVDLYQLENAYETLTTLYGFMQAISKTIDRRELLELIGRKILEIYPAARAVGVYLRVRDTLSNDDTFRLIHFASPTGMRGAPVLPAAIAHAALRAKKAIFDANVPEARTWGGTMYAPMIDRDEALGIIYVSTGDGTLAEFTSADLDLLDGIAVPAAITMQNTRMHEESLQRERLNRDLELAAQIQKSFLPREVLSVPGVEFLATYKAAYTVGGDFYDVFWVGQDLLAVFVGDISGKGIAAALLMARMSGELRVAALAHVDPSAVLAVMNKSVIDRNQPELFFTAVYFTLDVRTGEVCLASAGQPPPYLCRADGSVQEITDGASPGVGMLDDVQFASTRFFLEDGDSLVLYTDGVVEARALDGTLYGDDRLAQVLRGSGPLPKNISEHIMHSVGLHTKAAPANDDITIFICHRAESAPASLQPRRSPMSEPEPIPNTARLVTAPR